ncbi:MAG TPA: chondroitinase-B domain-containing protein [Polyangiaceae bacterium]|nr:chondroitinase-B domain-containing protein [Polyangiaceae bacterium]
MRIHRVAQWAGGALVLIASRAHAGNALTVSDPTLDPPTIVTLGVQMLITGDDNFDATVTVRYKRSSDTTFKTGMPLFRVHPEQLQSNVPPAQFAGSLFDLQPNTSYDIELHAIDPDGGDFVKTLTGKTLPVPGDPPNPHVVNVTDQTTLQAAVDAAQPGDVIVLANGTYGPYLNVSASGAPGNPIVIRGASQSGVVLDGGGCTACNVVEYYNTGNVHLENLTIQNASRAIRVQSNGTSGEVFRYLHIKNVTLGITTNADANGYYVADNVLEGRLVWPQVYRDDQGAHANDDGINIRGSANVIAYNRISGFGDAMKTEQDLVRANDFYGNDVLWTYDNGIELDGSYGNTRAFRNRWMNGYAPTSFQPIFGGPAYLFRNVIVNVADEPFKLHALGGVSSPSGGLILHNTVVKAGSSLQLSTADVAGNFVFDDNLFVANPSDNYSVRWDTPIVDPTTLLDYDGYYPDGLFELGYSNTGTNKTYPSFAAVQASGRFEQHGLLVSASSFASGLSAPPSYQPLLPSADVTLASGSPAIDKGVVIPNVNDGFRGAAPDLGAYELGCPVPTYGPRPQGVDESNTSFDCTGGATGDGGSSGDGGANGDGGAQNPGSSGGCGCTTAGDRAPFAPFAAVALGLGLALRRRRS